MNMNRIFRLALVASLLAACSNPTNEAGSFDAGHPARRQPPGTPDARRRRSIPPATPTPGRPRTDVQCQDH